MAKQNPRYQDLKAELDSIMAALQREDLDVDATLENYERGLTVIKQLEAYLEQAETKIRRLKAQFDQ